MTKTEKKEIQNMINDTIKPYSEILFNIYKIFEETLNLPLNLPFDINIPNETTLKAMQDADNGTDLTTYSSYEEMIKDLRSQCIK